MSTVEIILVTLVTAIGAIVHGSVGIGLGLIASPALLAIDTDFAPGPLLLAGQVIGARHVLVERASINRECCKRCLYGLPFGLIIGLVMLEMLSKRNLSIVIGSLVAIAAVALLAGVKVKRTPLVETISGAGTTFSSITAAMPGPPFVIAFSDMPANELRATSGAFFLMVATAATVTLTATGNFGTTELGLLGWLMPGVAIGLFAARFVRPYLDRPWFRPLVLVMALIGGVALVIRQLL